MNIVRLIARVLLGLLFTLAGASGFYLVFFASPPPMPPGLAADFQRVFFASHWVLFVDAVELLSGVLLLINRYVPLALLLLAGVLANILTFHITMQPAAIAPGLVATLLWFVIAWPMRAHFAPIFARLTPVEISEKRQG
jgi:putative oxidoreductase